MLYHFLYPLHDVYPVLNVFKYITFRTFGAILTALVLSFIMGPYLIHLLTQNQFSQVIRSDGPASHAKKSGTPTMGGMLIIISLVIATLLWADLSNRFIWVVLFITISFGFIGYLDDYLKISKKNATGLRGRYKIALQFVFSLGVMIYLKYGMNLDSHLYFPFFKNFVIDMGWLFIPFGMLVIIGTSNAVNLTDGLDGLAIGPVMINAGTFALLAYLAGHYPLSKYLQIPFVAGTGELTILCGAILSASLGFLWYNTYPASVFMGDIGSLSLGGSLGVIAVLTKNEILLLIIGGIFVIEALSVITQVVSYKLTKKRIFRMAPIHHHFELKGWAEPKIIVRFWIISFILAIVALSTLKLR